MGLNFIYYVCLYYVSFVILSMQLANFECPFIITIYQVELDSGTNTSLMTRNTSNCPNKLCWVQFSNLMAKQHTRYEMKVVASYQFIDVCTSMTIGKTEK